MRSPVPVADVQSLDRVWLSANPLPVPAARTDKNLRGRVCAIGGSATVPGGIQLTAEAALRAGAGKVQVATVRSAALALGMAMPEIAVFGLDETDEGEIAGFGPGLDDRLKSCNAVVVGPAMSCGEAAGRIVDGITAMTDAQCLLVADAAALMSLEARSSAVAGGTCAAILTPHVGEMAAMLGCDADTVHGDLQGAAQRAAERYHAIVVLKGTSTLIAGPAGELAGYAGGGAGLATSGSGDVLAGVIAGLSARGAEPWTAALWGVWLHGEAGRRTAERVGPIGFLARDLLMDIPGLMAAVN